MTIIIFLTTSNTFIPTMLATPAELSTSPALWSPGVDNLGGSGLFFEILLSIFSR